MIYVMAIIGVILGMYTIVGSVKGLSAIKGLESKYQGKGKRK